MTNETTENVVERTMDDYDKVNRIIQHIRPYIMADGGDVSLVSVEDGIVTIKMTGACAGCMMISETLDNGIKSWILEEVPTIKDVVLYDEFTEYYTDSSYGPRR